MTQEQFFQLIRNPQSNVDSSTKDLAQLVEQFPYSQPLRFIYLRKLKEQNSVHYNQQLKLTAVYAPDRTKLFNFVNEDVKNTGEIIPHSIAANEIKPEPEIIQEQILINEVRQEQVEELAITPPVSLDEEEFFTEEIVNETSVKPEPAITQKEVEEKELSPQDIINQRLRELNISQEDISHLPVLPEVDTEEDEEIEITIIQEEIISQPTESIEPSMDFRAEETTELKTVEEEEIIDDDLENNELELPVVPLEDEDEKEMILEQTSGVSEPNEGAEENSIPPHQEQISTNEMLVEDLILENLAESQFYRSEILLPESEENSGSIAQTNKNAAIDLIIPLSEDNYLQNLDIDTNKPHSFIEWLKISKQATAPPASKEEPKNHADISKSPSLNKKHHPSENLIDKFIEEEPRITPARSAFYSAANMARKSVVEDEELISETLANIYSMQGNFQKAISSYEKLLLKYPEKKTYFAALIENLKSKLNS